MTDERDAVMNDLHVETISRRILDTTVKMAGRDHLWVESVVMDQRCDFAFESVVRLDTKEIIRARGELKAGLHTASCEQPIENLSNLAGIVLGPGLIRQVVKVLGSCDGCGFILDAIVESARAVKQLNDSPIEVPKDLHTFGAVALKNFEMRARPDLANTCVPYRDGIEETFVERGVYPAVRADIYGPRPGQVNRFRRDKIIEIRIREDDLHLNEYMCDDSHEMKVDLHLDKKAKRVLDIETQAFRAPYRNICELPFTKSKELIGSTIDSEFGSRVRTRLGGPSGCTHLVDMILDTTRYLNAG
ncbi:MAG: DUF2889 domain-containing protein [Deltaproteobacteria bacterium]|nr:DUF2889 domain-containing protein [Deltaproteobacteria bacterium]